MPCCRRPDRFLGHRLLLLTHTGHSSGPPRHVLLKITGRDPQTGAYHLLLGATRSGFPGLPEA